MAATACHHPSANERKLIGTWESHSLDTAWQLTINADHSLSFAFDNVVNGNRFSPSVSGNWRLEGSELITEIDFRSLPGERDQPIERAKKIQRLTILTFGQDRFDVKGGYPYMRVK